MDVPNLNAAPPTRVDPPARESRGDLRAKPSPVPETSRSEGLEQDRIERTSELADQVERIREQLDRETELSSTKIREIREQLSEDRERTHQLILQAAHSILTGDLFLHRGPSP